MSDSYIEQLEDTLNDAQARFEAAERRAEKAERELKAEREEHENLKGERP